MEDEEYIDLKILGRGSNDEITKKVRSKIDQKIYVIKNIGTQKLSDNQKKVLNILAENKCPYIVKHYPLSEDKDNEIRTDFVNDVDLLDFINTYIDLEEQIENKILLKIFLQCAKSIKYLHNQNIIHRNIRLENFYMTDDKEVRLGNFRYATINGLDENINIPEDGILYKSADTLNKLIYDKKSDIYALGVVFYQMCYFQFPFKVLFKEDKNNGEYSLKENKENPVKEANISEEIKDLIKRMLNESKIPDIEEVFNILHSEYLKFNDELYYLESLTRCLSSFGFFSSRDKDPSKYNFEQNKIEIPIISTNLFYACTYFQNEEGEDKDRDKYIKFINNLRKNLIRNNIILKKVENKRTFNIVKYLVEQYLKKGGKNITSESFRHNSSKNIIFSLDEDYFLGKTQITQTNNKIYEYQFNLLNLNLDKIEKDKNTNKFNIIINGFKDQFNCEYNYLNIPRYLIIAIENERNDNKIFISDFPENFSIENIKIVRENKENAYTFNYGLSAILIRMIKDGAVKYISIYSKKKIVKQENETKMIIDWYLSEDNSTKKLNNLKEEINYVVNGYIEMVFYKNITYYYSKEIKN